MLNYFFIFIKISSQFVFDALNIRYKQQTLKQFLSLFITSDKISCTYSTVVQ